MSTKEQASVLLAQIDDYVRTYDRRRKRNKWRALLFRISIIGMSASTTILLGIRLEDARYRATVQMVALIFSALVTGISTIEALYNPRALWIRYTATTNELKALKMRLEYLIARGDDPALEKEVDALHEAFHHALEEVRGHWVKLRSKSDKEK